MNERSALRKAVALLSPREFRGGLVLMALAILGAFAEAVSIGAVFPFMSLLNNPAMVVENAKVHALFEWSGAGSVDRFVLMAALALLAVFLCKNLFLAVFYSLQARFVCNIEARLSVDLLAAYLSAPYLARLERNSADHIRIITGEVTRVTAGFMMPVINIVTEGLVVVAMTGLLLLVHPVATLLALILVSVVGASMHTPFRRTIANYRAQRVQAGTGMIKWVNESIGSLKETKVLGREDYFIGEFASNSHTLARANRAFTTISLMPRLVVEFSVVAALLLTVIIGITTGQPMQGIVPLLTLFGLAAVRIMPSATRILGAANNLRYYATSVDEVASDLKLVGHYSGQIKHGPRPAPRTEAFNVLELENVSFEYPGSVLPSLSHLSLRVNQGNIIAIVGKSGSGKTTLGDLLLGLLDPLEGTIRVNGRPVASLGTEWRGISGLVPQEPFLRDDTIRRNIAFGLPDDAIDDQRVWQALRQASLEDRVLQMPQLLDTPVGERGALLSGGERQRLSIARALYDDPAILVLDEATSALDPATEAEFIATLQSLKGQKTIVVITHRVASTAWCDRIFVMSAGRIVAEGRLSELAAHDRAFAELMGAGSQATSGDNA